MNIILRPVMYSDLNDLQQIFRGTIQQTCIKDYTENQINAWLSFVHDKKKWEDKISNQYFIVAEIEEQIVGFGSLENGNQLDLLYVHKDFLRQGVATKIFQALERSVLKYGNTSMYANVSYSAQPFFESMGFHIIEKNVNIINDVEIIHHRMGKMLDLQTEAIP